MSQHTGEGQVTDALALIFNAAYDSGDHDADCAGDKQTDCLCWEKAGLRAVLAALSGEGQVTDEMVLAAKRVLFDISEDCDDDVRKALEAALSAEKTCTCSAMGIGYNHHPNCSDTQDQDAVLIAAVRMSSRDYPQFPEHANALSQAADRITSLLEENAAIFKSLAAANERWEAAEADLAQAREVIAKVREWTKAEHGREIGPLFWAGIGAAQKFVTELLPVEPGDA